MKKEKGKMKNAGMQNARNIYIATNIYYRRLVL